jgi:hypothetical protein
VRVALDHAEDVYEDSTPNLDAFTRELQNALGDHPAVGRVRNAVESFVVHYVLNMFNGVQDSYDSAVKPLVENLAQNVSAHLAVLNLGWVVAHEDVERAGRLRVPALLLHDEAKPSPSRDRVGEELKRLAAEYRGARLPPPRPAVDPPDPPLAGPGRQSYLDAQLETLRRMSEGLRGTDYRDNFAYIAYRTLHLMSSRRASDFGDTRLFKAEDLPAVLALRGR